MEHLALNIAIVIAGVPMFEMQNFPAWANSSLVEKIKSCQIDDEKVERSKEWH